AAQRLAAADARLRAGCYDCLLGAYDTYDQLRSTPAVAAAATRGALEAAALLSIRERELGMVDTGRLVIARDLGHGLAEAPEWLDPVLDVAALLPPTISGGVRAPVGDREFQRSTALRRGYTKYQQVLRDAAPGDTLAAYTYTALMCAAIDNQPVPQ